MTRMPRTLATPIAVTALAMGGIAGTALATSAPAAPSASCQICASLQTTSALRGDFAETPPPPPPPSYQGSGTSPPPSSYQGSGDDSSPFVLSRSSAAAPSALN
jgi:hypothetical protein